METWVKWKKEHGVKNTETWTWRHGHRDLDIEIWTWKHRQIKWKTEAQAIFLIRLLIMQRKFADCPFSNGLNRRAHLWHRPAHLLKQQTSITVDRLPTKGNKLPISVSVCSEQMAVSRYRFPSAANKWKLPFSAFGCVCVHLYLYLYLYAAVSNRKGKPRRFSLIRSRCSSCKRKFVVCPFVDKEANGSYPFANGPNGENGFSIYDCM